MKPFRDKLVKDLKAQLVLGQRALVIGILLVGAGIFFFTRERADYRSCIHASGKIVAMDMEQDRKTTSYYPVVAFEDSNGVKRSFHTRNAQLQTWSGWTGYYRVGDSIGIFYPAENPENARLDNLPTVWLKTLTAGGIGLLFVIAGVLLWHGAKTCPVDELTSQDDPFYEPD